jgi:very-short-patch-repair endonuclease
VSEAEESLALHLRAHGVEFEREYRFAADACGGAGKGLRARLAAAGLRDWRADFAMVDDMLLVEVEGGGWSGGRHTRGAGFEGDLAKYDAAMRLGYTVYRCSPAMVKTGRAIETIMQLVKLSRSAINARAVL